MQLHFHDIFDTEQSYFCLMKWKSCENANVNKDKNSTSEITLSYLSMRKTAPE